MWSSVVSGVELRGLSTKVLWIQHSNPLLWRLLSCAIHSDQIKGICNQFGNVSYATQCFICYYKFANGRANFEDVWLINAVSEILINLRLISLRRNNSMLANQVQIKKKYYQSLTQSQRYSRSLLFALNWVKDDLLQI